ncbi:MAG: hypothetical protein HOB49_23045, partial [Gemmatimonadetes bacterium]|nr:hypothetical protein [Gemmatimonadota bacterium]
MSKAQSDGLARVQSESRIPASTWRDWCNRLELDPYLAVEVWDEVCNPMRTASGKAPDLTFILQLRAARPDHYIDDFRDELPAILLTSTLLDVLGEDDFAGGRGKAALLRLYRYIAGNGGDVVTRPYLVHVCCLLLLPSILPGEFTFRRLVRSICDGKVTLEDLLILARKKLPNHVAEEEVVACFDAAMALLRPTAALQRQESPDEDEDEDEDEEYDVAVEVDDDEEDDEDEEEEDGEEDEDEEMGDAIEEDQAADEEDDDEPVDDGPEAEFVSRFRDALSIVRDSEDRLTEELTTVLDRFDPFHVRIPSMEEAQRIAARMEVGRAAAQRQKSGSRPVLSAPTGGVKASGGRSGGGGGGGGGNRSSSISVSVPSGSPSGSGSSAGGAGIAGSGSGTSRSVARDSSGSAAADPGGTGSDVTAQNGTAAASSSQSNSDEVAGGDAASGETSGEGAKSSGVTPVMKEDGR